VRRPRFSPVLRLSGSPVRQPEARAALFLAVPVLLAGLGIVGCGYHLLGAAGALPPAVKSVAVMPFERQVPVVQVEQRITEAVTRELAQRAKVRVTSAKEGADAVLTGAVTGYGVLPMSYDSEGRANRYQITVSAKIRLAGADGKVLYEAPSYRFSETYQRSSIPSTYVDYEVVAYDVVARDFARALVASILEGGSGGE
jgi:outer membrane lipopolysaccharide assembly protein LptE/RlpB